ncbi:MAG: T9SS type A sorting domain-containing protein [Bacteroidota bacterium]
MKVIRFLKIFFLILTGIAFHLNCIGQPGCPDIDAGPDVILDSTGCTTLFATAIETGTTTNYNPTSIAYIPPYPFDTGTQVLTNIDDTWSGVINLPFTFCFFGIAYNQLVAGSNGCVSFSTTNSGAYCGWSFTVSCPDPTIISGSTGPFILGPYHDLYPAVTGNMYYNIYGSYPCRMFVLNFYQVPMYSCNTLLATHQIVLYETTNIIEVYIQNAPVCTTWNSGNKCIGIQDAAGTLGYSPPGRNTGAWSATNEAWRFTPNGVPNYSISWWQGGTLIANGDSVTVCPTNTTTYTAQIVYDCCTGTQVTVTDDVNVNAGSGINDEVNSNNNIYIMPNPAYDRVYIKTPEKNYTIEIYDFTGRKLLKENPANDQSIDISELAKGTYLFRITNGKETFINKIIKN